MNIKTNLLEEYIEFVANIKKQNKYFRIFLFLMVLIMFLFLFFVLLYNIRYINKQQLFSTTNTKNK